MTNQVGAIVHLLEHTHTTQSLVRSDGKRRDGAATATLSTVSVHCQSVKVVMCCRVCHSFVFWFHIIFPFSCQGLLPSSLPSFRRILLDRRYRILLYFRIRFTVFGILTRAFETLKMPASLLFVVEQISVEWSVRETGVLRSKMRKHGQWIWSLWPGSLHLDISVDSIYFSKRTATRNVIEDIFPRS